MSISKEELIKRAQQTIYAQTGQNLSAMVVDHLLFPRNQGALTHPDGYGRLTSACGGDIIEYFIKIKPDARLNVHFQAQGCAATKACASMLVELAGGKTIKEAHALEAHHILEALDGLPDHNQHCALLAVNALRHALIDASHLQREPWKKLYRQL